jgi:tripartite-type tricarboxylate transporter receptor subunit TctC
MKAFAVALVGAFAFIASSAHADDYPSRTIRIIVPFAPGGGADIAGRVVAKKLQENLKQTVVIESRPGATGTLAENFVANSDPDGYTILLATPSSHTIAPHLMKSLPYDALKDLAPVTEFAVVRQLIFVNAAKVPAKSLKELVALAHEKPGTLTYATSGTGSSGHLATESFARMTKMEMRAIPYKGVAPGITAAMTGEVDIMFGPAATALPYVQSGALRPIAAGTAERFPELPDVPTVAEAGWPAYKADAWLGFLVAAKTPKPIIDKLYTEIAKVMNSPDVRSTLDGLSITSMATTPEEFKKMMAKEYEDYGKLIKELGISTN